MLARRPRGGRARGRHASPGPCGCRWRRACAAGARGARLPRGGDGLRPLQVRRRSGGGGRPAAGTWGRRGRRRGRRPRVGRDVDPACRPTDRATVRDRLDAAGVGGARGGIPGCSSSAAPPSLAALRAVLDAAPAGRRRAPGPGRCACSARPGTGKLDRGGRGGGATGSAAAEVEADACLVLAPTRLAAARLRDAVTARLGGTTTTPLARTHQSFGFGVLREAAALAGDPPPRLLSGPEQDVILGELLAGHAVGATRPRRPGRRELDLALPTRTFRAELRDLLMRAVELGLEPERPRGPRAASTAGPSGSPAAHVLREYDEVTALSAAGRLRPGVDPRAPPPTTSRTTPTRSAGCASALRLVVVDDAQELTPAAAAAAAASSSATGAVDLVLLGDPDAATADLPRRRPPPVPHGVARRAHPASWPPRTGAAGRCAPPRRGSSATSGSWRALAHREVAPAAHGRRRRGPPAAHGRAGGRLRRGRGCASAHLLDGVPWSRMAVVVRGGSAHRDPAPGAARRGGAGRHRGGRPPGARRGGGAAVPRRSCGAPSTSSAGAEELDPTAVVDVLTSPVGGADAVVLRRLRRSLRRVELDDGGGRPSDVLLAEAVLAPLRARPDRPRGGPGPAGHRVLAAAVDALRDGVGRRGGAVGACGARAASPTPWRDAALGGGSGRRARRPRPRRRARRCSTPPHGSSTGCPAPRPADFLDHVLGQDVAGDTLVARAPRRVSPSPW